MHVYRQICKCVCVLHTVMYANIFAANCLPLFFVFFFSFSDDLFVVYTWVKVAQFEIK